MANILVFVEIRRGESTIASRFAVSEARRVASVLGATVYAVMALGPCGEEEIEEHARTIGRAGADRILCCADVALAGALMDATVGPFLASLADRLRPTLTLFPAGAVGPALGPPLALRTGALYHPRAWLEIGGEPASARLSLQRFRAADGSVRSLEAGIARGRAIVTTVSAGAEPGRHGDPIDEVQMLPYVSPPGGSPRIRELSSEPDDGEAVELAATVLAVAGDARPAELEALRSAAPAGTVVVSEGELPAGLELACPARLLVAGKAPVPSIVRRTLSPQTRVAVAGSKGAEKDLGRIDAVWRPSKEGLSALVAALGSAGDPGVSG